MTLEDVVNDSGKRLLAPLHFLKKWVQQLARKLGYEIRYVGRERSVEASKTSVRPRVVPYQENPEVGPVNYAVKMARAESGGPFEWPDMVVLNQAVASLVGPAKRIVELGGGTGCFAYNAAADPSKFVVCSELDADAVRWAMENRSRPNIQYVDRMIRVEDGPFDLVVAIDVIEHVQDYRSFLESCVRLAPRAILTTPNKLRDPQAARASPPVYRQHVREWSAGEFFWVLKMFYTSVQLLAMPNVYIPSVVPIEITDTLTPVIAVCTLPWSVGQFDKNASAE